MRVIILLLLFSNLVIGQTKKAIIFKTNSLNYLVKTGFNFSTEVQTNDKTSINFTFEKGNNKYNYVTEDRNKFVSLALEKRKYWNKDAKNAAQLGFFRGPFLKYRYKDKYQIGDNGFFRNGGVFTAHFVGVGYVIGYQKMIFKKIALEAKIGLGIQARLSIVGKTDLTPILPDGLIGLSFGIKI